MLKLFFCATLKQRETDMQQNTEDLQQEREIDLPQTEEGNENFECMYEGAGIAPASCCAYISAIGGNFAAGVEKLHTENLIQFLTGFFYSLIFGFIFGFFTTLATSLIERRAYVKNAQERDGFKKIILKSLGGGFMTMVYSAVSAIVLGLAFWLLFGAFGLEFGAKSVYFISFAVYFILIAVIALPILIKRQKSFWKALKKSGLIFLFIALSLTVSLAAGLTEGYYKFLGLLVCIAAASAVRLFFDRE